MSVVEHAKRVYEEELRVVLERNHHGEFVAIEPQSRSYFLGETFIDAAMSAKQAHTDRKSFVIRIGYDAAFHLGGTST